MHLIEVEGSSFRPWFQLEGFAKKSAYLSITLTKLILIGEFLDGDGKGDAVPHRARGRVQ